MKQVDFSFLKDEIAPVFIVIVLVGGYVFQVLSNGIIPEEYKTLVTAVVVYYFTAKGQQVAFRNGVGAKIAADETTAVNAANIVAAAASGATNGSSA